MKFNCILLVFLSILIAGECRAQRKIGRSMNAQAMLFERFSHEINTIARLAYEYRCRSFYEDGGQGSYLGFAIPDTLDSTSVGRYSLRDIQPDEIVISARCFSNRTSYLVVYDSSGHSKSSEYRQRGSTSEAFFSNNNAMVADMYLIVRDAMQWRKSSHIPTGSFVGFEIPTSLATTENGSYEVVEAFKDTVYVRATSSIGSGNLYFRINSSGTLRALIEGEYRPPE
jgi:hypothetical protein